MKYNLVVCGGTFDFLHKGHKSFLRFILSISEKVILGLTSDRYIQQYKQGKGVSPYLIREKELRLFLKEENIEDRVTIYPIDNACGPSTDPQLPLQAIVVTTETIKGADIVNRERKKLHLSELPIIIAPLVKNTEGDVLSSSKIRQGMMDEQGELYDNLEWEKEIYTLPITLRPILQRPMGEIIDVNKIKNIDENMMITVGDVTTQKIIALGYHPKLAVIDFLIERKKTDKAYKTMGFTEGEEILTVENPPATITPSLWRAINKVVSKLKSQRKYVLIVSGEEDLAVLPLVLKLPLGYHIFYGQPTVGMIHIIITPDIKQTIFSLLKQFKQKDY